LCKKRDKRRVRFRRLYRYDIPNEYCNRFFRTTLFELHGSSCCLIRFNMCNNSILCFQQQSNNIHSELMLHSINSCCLYLFPRCNCDREYFNNSFHNLIRFLLMPFNKLLNCILRRFSRSSLCFPNIYIWIIIQFKFQYRFCCNYYISLLVLWKWWYQYIK
jgi:hypothetical protein